MPVDSRSAAAVLDRISAYLELQGETPFKHKAYAGAARAIAALGTDDLAPLYRSGELAALRGVGPATLAVIRDLIEEGESRYLEQLRASTPEDVLAMLDVPGLSASRIRQIHSELGVGTLEELEAAARDGRLQALPKLGPRTAEK